MREYEPIFGTDLDVTIKIATQIEKAPPQLQEHPRLRSWEIGTVYKRTDVAIESYIRSKKSWEAKLTWTLEQSVKASRISRSKYKGKSYGKGDQRFRSPQGKAQPRGKGKGKGKGQEHTKQI